MTHEEAALLVPDLGLGRLEPEKEMEVRAHLAGCPDCTGLSDTYRLVATALRRGAAHPDPADLVAHAMGAALRPEVAAHLSSCPSCANQAAAIRAAESELGTRRIPASVWGARAATVALPLLLGYAGWVHLSVLPGMREAIGRAERDAAPLPEAVPLPLLAPATRGEGGPVDVAVRSGQRSVAVAVAPALPGDLPDAELLRIELRAPAGTTLYSRELTAGEVRALSGRSGAFAVVLPSSVLPGGDATLYIHAASRGELLAAPLRVRRE